jgi:hypothetical protein
VTVSQTVFTTPRCSTICNRGAVDEKLQREMIAVAAQRIKPKEMAPPERVFDFSFALKVAETLR